MLKATQHRSGRQHDMLCIVHVACRVCNDARWLMAGGRHARTLSSAYTALGVQGITQQADGAAAQPGRTGLNLT